MHGVKDLFLGTVKIGVPQYGFSSSDGRESLDPVQFLHDAANLGIARFDTSPRYGNSEEMIGQYVKNSNSVPFVASKIDNLVAGSPDTPKIMEQSVRASLSKLNLPALDICYLHQNEMEIIADPYVHKGLSLLKKQGLIQQAGASIYSEQECAYAVSCGVFDVIQLPVNVFDLGLYNIFVEKNPGEMKLVARSLLLQGLLVNRGHIKRRLKQWKAILEYLKKLDEIAHRCGLPTLDMALAFVSSLPGIDYCVIGTTTFQNLKHDIECLKKELPKDTVSELKALASAGKQWANPRNWN